MIGLCYQLIGLCYQKCHSAGSGKEALARGLASKLGFNSLDTNAILSPVSDTGAGVSDTRAGVSDTRVGMSSTE